MRPIKGIFFGSLGMIKTFEFLTRRKMLCFLISKLSCLTRNYKITLTSEKIFLFFITVMLLVLVILKNLLKIRNLRSILANHTGCKIKPLVFKISF